MKKWLLITSILWLFQFQEPQMTVVEDTLIIEVSDTFTGTLYHDTELVEVLEDEDFINGVWKLEKIEAGFYTLFDEKGELVSQCLIEDESTHIAFLEPVMDQKENIYLFQKQPRTLIYSAIKADDLEGEALELGYLYQIEDLQFTFLDTDYVLEIDDTAPIVRVGDLVSIEENVYITSQPTMTLTYEDTYPESFIYFEKQEMEVTLEEGINDLSGYLMDCAKNQAQEKLWVIYDSKAPQLDVSSVLYLQYPRTLTIEESYLDLEKSYYTIDTISYPMESSQLELNQSGMYEAYLYDLAGNQAIYQWQVVIDQIQPSLSVQLDNQTLTLVPSEILQSSYFNLYLDRKEISMSDFQTVLLEEGVYNLIGTMVDLAGNRTEINKTIVADFNAPSLEISLNDTLYLAPVFFEMEGSDLFDFEWRIELYRNDELIETKKGTGNFHLNMTLSEELYEDGKGNYTIHLWAKDGLYESEVSKSCVVDMKCTPINLYINHYEANQVSKLMMQDNLTLNAKCLEGDVYYRLVSKNGEIKEGKMAEMNLTKENQLDYIEFFVEDENGFKQYRRLDFYEREVSSVEMLANTTIDTSSQETKPTSTLTFEPIAMQWFSIGKNKNYSFYLFGGVGIAIIALRWLSVRYLRFKRSKRDLSSQSTLPLTSEKDTIILSSHQDE